MHNDTITQFRLYPNPLDPHYRANSIDLAAAEHLQFHHNPLELLASNYQAMGMKMIAFGGPYFLDFYVL